jgi:hypothetical protein
VESGIVVSGSIVFAVIDLAKSAWRQRRKLSGMRWLHLLVLTGLAFGAGPMFAATDDGTPPESRSQRESAPQVCAGPSHVTVQASAKPDAEAACVGARRALEFLAQAGLDGLPGATIDIVPELPGDLAGRAVGCYERQTKRVLLLSFDAFQAGGGWFRMPPSWELYRAAAAHEMAHAVVGCLSAPRRLPVAAHEYVAYVVFFATMEPSLRSALLLKFPGSGFTSTGQISDIQHMVNPSQFGVDAWRHYLKVDDRARWLRQVIAGDVVPEVPDDPDASSR